jgi:DNA-binding NtrC family response regulator
MPSVYRRPDGGEVEGVSGGMTDVDREARRRRKLRHTMAVLVRHKGVVKAAAHELGMSERTIHEQMTEYCAREGYATLFEAAYELGLGG